MSEINLAMCHFCIFCTETGSNSCYSHICDILLILYIIDGSVISRCVKIRFTCDFCFHFLSVKLMKLKHLGYILLLLLLLLRLVAKAYSHCIKSEREKLPTDYKQCPFM